RVQIITHDGDQNKSGGDAGEFCVTLKIPGVPGIKVLKEQSIGGAPFTHNPVTGNIGDTVNYRMTVTNTGSVSEPYSFSDPQCDANTLSPAGTSGTLGVGQSVVYTCSHVLNSSDTTSGFTNAACARSGQLQSCDHVHVDVPGMSVLKLAAVRCSDLASGVSQPAGILPCNGTFSSYTHGTLTVQIPFSG